MKEKIKNYFDSPDRAGQVPQKREVMRRIAALGVMCMLLFAAVSCDSSKEPSASDELEDSFDLGVPTGVATGTIIGEYSHGRIASLLVQVDEQYPIGEAIRKSELLGSCVRLPSTFYGYEVLQNLIQVQPQRHLPLPNWQKDETLIERRISFSYRKSQRAEGENERGDSHLFVSSGMEHTHTGCPPPDVPVYVVTDIQILN
jgi:hypothetical protein